MSMVPEEASSINSGSNANNNSNNSNSGLGGGGGSNSNNSAMGRSARLAFNLFCGPGGIGEF